MPRLGLAVAVFITSGAGCASARYVGTIAPTGVYGNLGYGLTLNLQANELSARWKVIDPASPEDGPPADRPLEVNAPLDLDGDGELEGRETTRFLRPTLRLLARSATAAGARVDVDVVILGGAELERPLDEVAASALRELVGPSAVAAEWTTSKIAPDFEARTTTGSAGLGAYRLTVIDQTDFQGEAAARPRRQSVRILMVAPTMTDALATDFDRVLGALSLAAQGGPVGHQDRW